MLGRATKATGGTDNVSIASDETFDLTTTAIEVPGTSRPTRANPPVVAAENVQIIDEGDDAANKEGSAEQNNANENESINVLSAATATPRSISIRTNRDEINSPMSVSVRDQQAARVSVTD